MLSTGKTGGYETVHQTTHSKKKKKKCSTGTLRCPFFWNCWLIWSKFHLKRWLWREIISSQRFTTDLYWSIHQAMLQENCRRSYMSIICCTKHFLGGFGQWSVLLCPARASKHLYNRMSNYNNPDGGLMWLLQRFDFGAARWRVFAVFLEKLKDFLRLKCLPFYFYMETEWMTDASSEWFIWLTATWRRSFSRFVETRRLKLKAVLRVFWGGISP